MVKNKKSNATYIFVLVTISIISFFVYVMFFQSVIGFVASEKDDLVCRALITGQSVGKVPAIGVYFYEMSRKCKVDDIKEINNKDYDSMMKPIVESMKRCWFRYGEGQVDFLSTWDTTGNWCFKCANLEYENKGGTIYEYKDLLIWMQNNYFETKNGTMSYYDYVNVVEIYGDDSNLEREDFLEALSDNDDIDEELRKFYYDMQFSTFDFLNSYKFKQINPSENIYVVYRFIRVEKDLIDDVLDFALAAGTTSAGYGIYRTSKQAIFSPVDTVKKIKNVNTVKIKKRLNVIKRNPIATAVIGSLSYVYATTNRNYIQYVDVMTQEQYYRLCGTERFSD